MVFSSLTFLAFFLPLVILAHTLVKGRLRNAVLLVFSLVFYAWGEPRFILVMLLTVSVNYLAGRLMEKAASPGSIRACLFLGVGAGLFFLLYFKYTGFLLENLSRLTGAEIPFTVPRLPIGISFYTFQVLTYTIDVYRGRVPVQKSFWDLLLYVSFFPQLIAGPIVNYKDIVRQLEKRRVTLNDVYHGFLRFLIGLNKKILIANTCGEIVRALDQEGPFSFTGAWLMALAFTFQIYYDFSGYSDMAIGLGRIFGFRFLENFDHPYVSRSVTAFWRRWHMSLGAFFREYVYIPLGGNRVSRGKWIRNLLIVWALTGIWHGASWNFVLWGLYYALFLIAEKLFLEARLSRLPGAVRVGLTFLVSLTGWVIFYHTDLARVGAHLLALTGIGASGFADAVAVYQAKRYFGFLVLAALFSYPWFSRLRTRLGRAHAAVLLYAGYLRPVFVTALYLISVTMLVGQSYNPFLYFRF